MTARHVVRGYWDRYNNPGVRMDRPGKKRAGFEMFAVHAQGNNAEPALWAASKLSVCPYSDLALISVVPVNEVAKAQPPLAPLRLSILPPIKGERIAAFGFASTSITADSGLQVTFGLNPSTAMGAVTEVFPEKRDSCLLSRLLQVNCAATDFAVDERCAPNAQELGFTPMNGLKGCKGKFPRFEHISGNHPQRFSCRCQNDSAIL